MRVRDKVSGIEMSVSSRRWRDGKKSREERDGSGEMEMAIDIAH